MKLFNIFKPKKEIVPDNVVRGLVYQELQKGNIQILHDRVIIGDQEIEFFGSNFKINSKLAKQGRYLRDNVFAFIDCRDRIHRFNPAKTGDTLYYIELDQIKEIHYNGNINDLDNTTSLLMR